MGLTGRAIGSRTSHRATRLTTRVATAMAPAPCTATRHHPCRDAALRLATRNNLLCCSDALQRRAAATRCCSDALQRRVAATRRSAERTPTNLIVAMCDPRMRSSRRTRRRLYSPMGSWCARGVPCGMVSPTAWYAVETGGAPRRRKSGALPPESRACGMMHVVLPTWCHVARHLVRHVASCIAMRRGACRATSR